MLIGSLRDGWTKYFDIKIPRDPSFMRVTGRWAGQDPGSGYQSPLTHFTFHKLIKAIWIIILPGIDSQIPQAYITWSWLETILTTQFENISQSKNVKTHSAWWIVSFPCMIFAGNQAFLKTPDSLYKRLMSLTCSTLLQSCPLSLENVHLTLKPEISSWTFLITT